jgi:integrase
MARQTNRLTDIKLRALNEPGMHPDGDGLYLRITSTGTKGWIYRFRQAGRLRDMGLGKYPTISLAAARGLMVQAYQQIKQGIDPIDERRRRTETITPKHVITFSEAADRYIAAHDATWKNAKHRYQWRATIDNHAAPIIGGMDVATIATDDVLRILEPIWYSKAETANRLRGRIESVLDWAKVRGLRQGENPARWRGHLAHLLPSRNRAKSVRHHPALAWSELPEFMTELRIHSAVSARALEFTILTATRTTESIEAVWPEIDIQAGIWTIPKERMKGGRQHRIPLANAAIAIIDELPQLAGNAFVFPGGRKGRPFSNMAMLKLLRGMRPGLTVHGFRSTFRDWVAEATTFPRELAEAALAHIVGNAVERAYQRGDLFEKRRQLMQKWAEFALSAR